MNIEEHLTKRRISILMENQKNIYNQYYDKNLIDGRGEVIDLISSIIKKNKTDGEIKSFLSGLVEEATALLDKME